MTLPGTSGRSTWIRSETGSGGWPLWIVGSGPSKSLMYAFGTQYFKNMVFDDPSWDFRTFNVDPIGNRLGRVAALDRWLRTVEEFDVRFWNAIFQEYGF